MNELKRLFEMDSDREMRTVSQLLDLYDGTIDELRFCANVNPVLELDPEAADKRELDLLNFESDLLEQAAHIPLNSKDDILKLMDLWAKASGIDEGDQPSTSDRIAMNIFRHLNKAQFSVW